MEDGDAVLGNYSVERAPLFKLACLAQVPGTPWCLDCMMRPNLTRRKYGGMAFRKDGPFHVRRCYGVKHLGKTCGECQGS